MNGVSNWDGVSLGMLNMFRNEKEVMVAPHGVEGQGPPLVWAEPQPVPHYRAGLQEGAWVFLSLSHVQESRNSSQITSCPGLGD